MRTTIANRMLNPLVIALLRSPLHPLASRTNALVTCRSRRTGRAYTLPLRYAQDETGLWLHAAKPDTKTWWRSLEGGAPVTVRLRGREVHAHAEAIRDERRAASTVCGPTTGASPPSRGPWACRGSRRRWMPPPPAA